MNRFWNKVDVRGPDDCWEWTASKRNGYGRIGMWNGYRCSLWSAHRLALILWHGEDVDDSLKVCHQCDNPSCVNPHHLFIATQAQNVEDMVAKGRHSKQKNTHCPHGHIYSGENLCTKKGYRVCIECRRLFDNTNRWIKRKMQITYY